MLVVLKMVRLHISKLSRRGVHHSLGQASYHSIIVDNVPNTGSHKKTFKNSGERIVLIMTLQKSYLNYSFALHHV
jgi:hypothetical protein